MWIEYILLGRNLGTGFIKRFSALWEDKEEAKEFWLPEFKAKYRTRTKQVNQGILLRLEIDQRTCFQAW